jgi:hypothetical protein
MLSMEKSTYHEIGSIGHLGSAATVAASSFEMQLRDPHELLNAIDKTRWNFFRRLQSPKTSAPASLVYVEPHGLPPSPRGSNLSCKHTESWTETDESVRDSDILVGKVQRLGDFIDTDAVRNFPTKYV